MTGSFSFEVLKLRDFRLLVLARIATVMALMAQDVIIGWQVYSITHSPFMLGMIGLTEAVPALVCALWAGHVVDSRRPHRVFQIAQLVLALNIGALCLIAGGHIPQLSPHILPILFVGIFLSGMARSFLMPAAATLLPQIVPRRDISSAAAWSSSGFQIGCIGGPAIAGVLYGYAGVSVVWWMPLVLMVAAFVMLSRLSVDVCGYQLSRTREPIMQSIRGGFQFILNNPVLLSVMILDMFAVLFGGAVAMLPAVADQILHVGSEGLGALRAASAVGAILMAMFLAIRPFRTIRATTLMWVIAGFGACIIGFGLSESFALSMLFLVLSGMFDSVSMVIRGTLMQWLTTDEVRGRVTSVNSMFIISSNEIGAFESGVAAKLLGLAPSIVFGGAMTLLVVASTALLSPKFRRTQVKAE